MLVCLFIKKVRNSSKAFKWTHLGVTVFVPFRVDLVSDEPKCQESDFDAGASK